MVSRNGSKMIPVMVATEHRGVFAGLVPADQDMSVRTIRLVEARCAIYWATTKGIAELAADGPNSGSTIGAPATLEALHDITAIWKVEPHAWEKWREYAP